VLSENQIATLQKLAKDTGLVISELVRRTVDAYLVRQKERDEALSHPPPRSANSPLLLLAEDP
jgi:hypothetical protein